MKVLDALAQALVTEGVTAVANVPDELTVFAAQALAEQGVRIVRPRHEQTAVLIADGMSRTAGGVGVCMVGAGPAVAQTGTALVTARRKRSPVLVLAGSAPVDVAGRQLKELDTRAFVETLGLTFVAAENEGGVVGAVHRAFRHLRSGAGPVVVDLPHAALTGEYAPHGTGDPAATTSQAQDPAPEPPRAAIEEAAAVLHDARRPLIFAGRGAVLSEAREEIEALAARIGAPIATSLQARGYFGAHPQQVGILGTFAGEAVTACLAQADCVLAVGVSMNPYQTGGGRISQHARIVHVERDPGRVGAHSPVDLEVVGDARASVAALDAALAATGMPARRFWAEAHLADAAATGERGPASASRQPDRASDAPWSADRLLAEVEGMLPEDRRVVVDGGRFMYDVVRRISVPGPHAWLWSLDFGSIGLGLGMAIGAAVADPSPLTVLFVGDGGLAMSLQELETVVREDVPLLVVVLDNGAYDAETRMLAAAGKPTTLSRFGEVDFAGVARHLGAEALTLRGTSDLAAFRERLAPGLSGPLLLDAKIPPSTAQGTT